jgi:hypothetical protein
MRRADRRDRGGHKRHLILANARARGLFRLDARADVGRPLRDLEISYRPVELRSLIEQARGERRTVSQRNVSWPHAGAGGTALCWRFTSRRSPTRAARCWERALRSPT